MPHSFPIRRGTTGNRRPAKFQLCLEDQMSIKSKLVSHTERVLVGLDLVPRRP